MNRRSIQRRFYYGEHIYSLLFFDKISRKSFLIDSFGKPANIFTEISSIKYPKKWVDNNLKTIFPQGFKSLGLDKNGKEIIVPN
jgi:hypothetical protein